jgi:transcriptional regulator with XRE-family HTH domain
LHNRHTSRFIIDWLEAQGWTESKLAKESGVSRPVVSAHLWSGTRKIRLNHLKAYMSVMNHQDRPKLVAAWLRDHIDAELLQDVLDADGVDVSRHVKEFVPALEDENKRMLAWLAREIARDGEVGEFFKILSARLGYRPRRTAAK